MIYIIHCSRYNYC